MPPCSQGPKPTIPISKSMSPPSCPLSTRPPCSLGPEVPWGLDGPHLTESRPGSPFLYMCWWLYIIWCMKPGCWLSVWDIWEVQVIWDCWSSYRVDLFLSFFQLFPNSSTGVPSFCLLVAYKFEHLTLSPAGLVFQRAVMISPFFVSTE